MCGGRGRCSLSGVLSCVALLPHSLQWKKSGSDLIFHNNQIIWTLLLVEKMYTGSFSNPTFLSCPLTSWQHSLSLNPNTFIIVLQIWKAVIKRPFKALIPVCLSSKPSKSYRNFVYMSFKAWFFSPYLVLKCKPDVPAINTSPKIQWNVKNISS